MAYGFEVYNSSGTLVANSTDFNYGLIYSGQLFINTGGLAILYYPDTVEMPLIFIRNSSNLWVGATNVTTTQAFISCWEDTPSGYTYAYGPYRKNSGGITIQFKIFTPFKYLGNVSGQNFGIQVYDSSSAKTFDSNYEIPLITNVSNITLPNPTNSNPCPVTQVALPSGVTGSPWFSLSPIISSSINTPGQNGIIGTWVPDLILGVFGNLVRCVRVYNGYLQLSYGVYTPVDPTTYYTWASGAGTQKLFYFQNVVSTPLEGSINVNPSNGIAVCNYDPVSTNYCTTLHSLEAVYSGGNATTVTYDWSFVSNPGGFTFLSSTTGFSATITNAKSDTNTTDGSPTIYNATVQCIISQSGSTPVTAQLAVSSSHLASVTPLAGGTITASNVINSCSYVGGGGTCTTSETHTVGTVTGGNGTALTYSWDFAANAGGFSFSTATNGTAVGITRTAGAGTYTCTTRCTISQTGMTPLVVTYAVSHTHTESAGNVINPLGFNGTEYIDSGDNYSENYLYMYSDGTWQIYGNNALTQASGNWWSQGATAGIGNSYWVNFILTSQNSTSYGYATPTSGWNLLNTTRTIGVYADSTTGSFTGALKHATYTVQLSAASAGSVISQSTIYLRAFADYVNPSCPDPNTPIYISTKNTVLAKDIKVGDIIYTMHHITGEYGLYKVTHAQIKQQQKLLFVFDDSTTLVVSTSHKFWQGGDRWIKASKLVEGDIVKHVNGNKTIISITDVGIGEVVQFEVEDAHTYIANGYISHNAKQEN